MSVEPPLMRDVLNGVLNSRVDASGLFSSFPYTQLTTKELAIFLATGTNPVVSFAYPPGDIRRYGGVGDGTTDNTTALVNWAKAASPGLGLTLESGGVYIFDPSAVVNGILFSAVANFAIYGNNATIKAKNGSSVVAQHEMMRFNNCQDVYAENFTVDANRANRTPVESTTHNLNIADNCARILFKRIRCINAVTDGFYVGSDTPATASTYPADVTFEDCIGDNAFRNAFTAVASTRLKIVRGRYINSTGTAPEAGIDAEPDAGFASGNTGLEIIDTDVSGNAGIGCVITGPSSAPNVNVIITRLSGASNSDGFLGIYNAVGIRISGLNCGSHSTAIRGIVELDTSVSKCSIDNLVMRSISANGVSNYGIYISSNVTGPVKGSNWNFETIDCTAIFAARNVRLDGIKLESITADPAFQMTSTAAQSVVHDLDVNSCDGTALYIDAADADVGDVSITNYGVVAATAAIQVESNGARSVIQQVSIVQTTSVPAGSKGIRYNGVAPKILRDMTAYSAGTDFTSANVVSFLSGVAGAHLQNITPQIPIQTVASAATITLPRAGQSFLISGTTNISSITALDWDGLTVTLIFQGALTMLDGSNLKLNGNFGTANTYTMTLSCDGTNWYEVARSTN